MTKRTSMSFRITPVSDYKATGRDVSKVVTSDRSAVELAVKLTEAILKTMRENDVELVVVRFS
jgi:hypothetical protein